MGIVLDTKFVEERLEKIDGSVLGMVWIRLLFMFSKIFGSSISYKTNIPARYVADAELDKSGTLPLDVADASASILHVSFRSCIPASLWALSSSP